MIIFKNIQTKNKINKIMLQEENNIEEQLIPQVLDNQYNTNDINNKNDANKINNKNDINKIIKILKKILLITILTLLDIYFELLCYTNCSYINKLIININVYNYVQIYVNFSWIIFTILMTTSTNDSNEYKKITETMIINIFYYLFSIIWSIVGFYMYSTILNNDLCNNVTYNYLFIRLLINYFYNICNILQICKYFIH